MNRKIIYRIFLKRIKPFLKAVLFSGNRINEEIRDKYWYPLAFATYDESEIMEALDAMTSFKTSMFEKTLAFEKAFSNYQNCRESIMVNSGSSADLLLSFLLTNPLNPLLKKGDKVLVPALTWPTQIWSIMMAGLEPVFVDVDPKTLNIDYLDLEKKISDDTKAIFVVHILGNPCDMDIICELSKNHNLIILEDCAEALGSQWNGKNVGTFGLGSAFSFFFSHHMTTMEGGMICVNDKTSADHIRVMRSHGWTRNIDSNIFDKKNNQIEDKRYEFHNWGFNVRPTEVQAAFGMKQIEKLPVFNKKRTKISSEIFSLLYQYDFFVPTEVHPKGFASWLGIPIVLKNDCPFSIVEFSSYLEKSGIETRPILTGNILRQPVASKLFSDISPKSFKGAEYIHENGIYIGLSPNSSSGEIERLKNEIKLFINKY